MYPSLKGLTVLLSGLMCILLFGCGTAPRDVHGDHAPSSNVVAGKTAINKALEDLGFPEGGGRNVACSVESGVYSSTLVSMLVTEYFHGKDYDISEGVSGLPEIKVTIDTLTVTLTRESPKKDGMIKRVSEVRVGVVYSEINGERRVYSGTGIIEDRFSDIYLQTLGTDDPHVRNLTKNSRLVYRFKPLIIGGVMTIFTWMLYSYRG